MNIAVIGAGYVGLTTGAVLAEQGHHIVIVERIKEKMDQLHQGIVPFYEPGLSALVRTQIEEERLRFAPSLAIAVHQADIDDLAIDGYLICVGTPPQADGSSDLSAFGHVIEELAPLVRPGQIIITKSSVPPGTNAWIDLQFHERGVDTAASPVISNPEFLREGTAIADTKQPSRIVYGLPRTMSPSTMNDWLPKLRDLYRDIQAPLMITTWEGAELIKYASNAFLANKISFVNEMARICDAFAVNIQDVATGIGLDPRIGSDFLRAGLGYGGSCLPKDLAALIFSATEREVPVELLPAIARVNNGQIIAYIERLEQMLSNLSVESTKAYRIAMWGLAFKGDTDDTRMSPALQMLKALLSKGYHVTIYDPVVTCAQLKKEGFYDSLSPLEQENLEQATSMMDAVTSADALIVCTDWRDFQQDNVDWAAITKAMRNHLLLDTRNLYDPLFLSSFRLLHLGIARPNHPFRSIIK